MSLEDSQLSLDYSSPTRFTTKTLLSTITFIITSSITIILLKIQKISGLKKKMISYQSFLIFLSQYLCLLFFSFKFILNKKKELHFQKLKNKTLMTGKAVNFSNFKIALLSFLNVLGINFLLFAFWILPFCIFQSGFIFLVILTPFFSRLINRKIIFKHIYLGIVISCFSILSLTTSFFFISKKITFTTEIILSLFLLFLGFFFLSLSMVYEEYLLKYIEISEFRFLGLQGLYSIFFLFSIHVVFLGISIISGNSQFLDIGNDFFFIWNNKEIFFTSLLIIFFSGLSYICGVYLTRKVGATFRVYNEILKLFFYWVFEVFFFDLKNENQDWKMFFFILIWRFLSLCFLFCGSLIVNEFQDITCCGFDKFFGRYNDDREDNLQDAENDYYVFMKT